MGEAFEVLAQSRPTAVNLFWAIDRMKSVMNNAQGSVREIANILLEEAHDIKREDIEINRAMGKNGAELLNDGARVLTHCNAGALATAGHVLGRPLKQVRRFMLLQMRPARFYKVHALPLGRWCKRIFQLL